MMRHGKRFTTFQSTLPREERLFEVKNLGKVLLFQSTLPREERHRGNRRRSDCYNFNPRSHERSDEVEAKRKAKLEISIHAPTRGATVRKSRKTWNRLISIHAPTRGATDDEIINNALEQISIHAPTRGATDLSVPLSVLLPISIHAPTRGATIIDIINLYNEAYFNPRSHERSDTFKGPVNGCKS